MSMGTKQLASMDVNIGIQDAKREGVAELLKHLLADEHVLYIKLRNYHWNVTGIHFQQLHAFFEEQYTAVATYIDDTAERIRSLGFFAPGSMEEFSAYARLQESSHLNGNAGQMLENLLQDHEAIIRSLRKDQEAAMEQYGDAGTQDFLIALMEAHEKHAWMVRSHLAG
ncbi:MAG: DNA starvation/stationary phase protection protein [Phaeodactylibacter sp.]|nr:DNA starvation/stationary phase protection protein [Phaeodactylibacter sp.]